MYSFKVTDDHRRTYVVMDDSPAAAIEQVERTHGVVAMVVSYLTTE